MIKTLEAKIPLDPESVAVVVVSPPLLVVEVEVCPLPEVVVVCPPLLVVDVVVCPPLLSVVVVVTVVVVVVVVVGEVGKYL